ncbi:MAG: polysaccharide deacetylase family protein [Rhodocyclales bacterium]|nr:polysaccharide deacetylase family protein [Rhodocyclales bacterium]
MRHGAAATCPPTVPTAAPARGRGGAALRALLATLALLAAAAADAGSAAILVYHRFGEVVADSMTTRTATFAAQLVRLRAEGYAIVPLATVVDGLAGRAPLPEKAVAITVDDGHRTVYTELLPIIRRERLPVTLFIYPSAIANAAYALTWEQLAEIVVSGLVDVQSHTWWHPDFRVERRRLAPDAYRQFVREQLEKPRRTLRSRLGTEAAMLAWPFGIHDAELETAAAEAGYRAAFALGERHASDRDPPLALPRYLIVDGLGVAGLLRLLRDGARRAPEAPR